MLMSRAAKVAHFALGCEYAPLDVGPGLASMISSRKLSGKTSCVCRGLYPFYQVNYEHQSSKYTAFFDGCRPIETIILTISQQTLQMMNDKFIELSETSNTERAIEKLRELKRELQKKDQKQTFGAVSREVADILFSYFKYASPENISVAICFQPNIDEREVIDCVNELLHGETETRKSIESMVESVKSNMVGRLQRNVDEAFDCLKLEKADRIEVLTQNLRDHEAYVKSLHENLDDLQAVLNDNTILLNQIKAQLREAQHAQVTYIDQAERYRLKPRISELKIQKEKATAQRDELLKRQEGLRQSLDKENHVIESLQSEIQRIRDHLPDDLRKGVDNLESLQLEFESVLEELKYAEQNSQGLLDNSITQIEENFPAETTSSSDQATKIDVSLFYIPFYMVETKKALGIRSSAMIVTPFSLPTSIDTIGTDALSKYLAEAIHNAPKSDLNSLWRAASDFNLLKRKGGKELIQQGMDYVLDHDLLRGLT